MFQNTHHLDINPLSVTLHISYKHHKENTPINENLIGYIYHLINKYFKQKSIILIDDFSKEKLKNDLNNYNRSSIKFESTDATILSELSKIKFPNSIRISASVNHIQSDTILTYNSLIKHNLVTTLSFQTIITTAQILRNMFQTTNELYDKYDFINEHKLEYDIEKLSSKIYKSKSEFLQKELQFEV